MTDHNNDGPATPAETGTITIPADMEVKEIVEKANDYLRKVHDAGLFQEHDIYKNRKVEIDEDLIGYIHWLDDGCHDPIGGCDESMFMTQEQVDERLRKSVNRWLRSATRIDEHMALEKEIIAWEKENPGGVLDLEEITSRIARKESNFQT